MELSENASTAMEVGNRKGTNVKNARERVF